MFLIKGITKSGDCKTQVMDCNNIPEALSLAKERYNIIHSIRYYSGKEKEGKFDLAQSNR